MQDLCAKEDDKIYTPCKLHRRSVYKFQKFKMTNTLTFVCTIWQHWWIYSIAAVYHGNCSSFCYVCKNFLFVKIWTTDC